MGVSTTEKKNAEINILGNSAKGLLANLNKSLFVKIPNCKKNEACELFILTHFFF